MKMNVEFSGLTETLKALEECATDKELRRTNKAIVERAQPTVHQSMKKRIPVSADNSKSGRGLKGGRSSRPEHGHAKDNIPIEKVRVRGTTATGEVGWTLSDNSEYFYMKFVEWGTVNMPPRPFIAAAAREADRPLRDIAEEEYTALLARKLGG